MSKKLAAKFMFFLSIGLILFHVLVMLGFIPYTIVWAGRLKSVEEMYMFEAISVALHLLLTYAIAQRAGYLKDKFPEIIVDLIIWTFIAIFLVNTLINIFSELKIEFILGSLLTLVSALFCWLSVRNPKKA